MNVSATKLILLSVIAVTLWYSPRVAAAQEMDVITAGEIEYDHHCASCHGTDGRGQGVMARYLTIEPTDLTSLAKKNDGSFPFWQVYRTIDGREEIRGHGTRKMPVWGSRFSSDAGGEDSGSRSQVAGRILGLVFYLQHIQK